MAITSLKLLRYKQFIGFDAGVLPKSGLIVVEGPNEAGKSTLREALGWLLFGARSGSSLAEVEARLELVGRRLLVRRGPDGVVVDELGQPRADGSSLAVALAGTDQQLYSAIFSFDGIELQQLKSLDEESVKRRLAASALVGAGRSPNDVVKELSRLEQALYKPRAGGMALNNAKQALARLKAELEQASQGQHGLERLEQKIRELATAEAGLVLQRRAISEEEVRLSQLMNVRPLWDDLVLARQTLAALDRPSVEPRCLREVVDSGEELLRETQKLVEAVEVERRAADEVALVVVDERLVLQAGRIESLHRQAAAVLEADQRVRHNQGEVARGEARLEAWARTLCGDAARPRFTSWLAEVAPDERLLEADLRVSAGQTALDEATRRELDERVQHDELAASRARLEDELSALTVDADAAALEQAAAVGELERSLGRREQDGEQRELARVELVVGLGGFESVVPPEIVAFPALDEGDLLEIERRRDGWMKHLTERETRRSNAGTQLEVVERELGAWLQQRDQLVPTSRAPMNADEVARLEAKLDILEAGEIAAKGLFESHSAELSRLGVQLGVEGAGALVSLRERDLSVQREAQLAALEQSAERARVELARREGEVASRPTERPSPLVLATRRKSLVELRGDFDALREAESRTGESPEGARQSRLVLLVALLALGGAAVVALVTAAWVTAAVLVVALAVALVLAHRARQVSRPVAAVDLGKLRGRVGEAAHRLALPGVLTAGIIHAELDEVTRAVVDAEEKQGKQASQEQELERAKGEARRADDALRAALAEAEVPAGCAVREWFTVCRVALARLDERDQSAQRIELAQAGQREIRNTLGGVVDGARPPREALVILRRLIEEHRERTQKMFALEARIAEHQKTSSALEAELQRLETDVAGQALIGQWSVLCEARRWPTLGGLPDEPYLAFARAAHKNRLVEARRRSIERQLEVVDERIRVFDRRLSDVASAMGESMAEDGPRGQAGDLRDSGEVPEGTELVALLGRMRARCDGATKGRARRDECERELVGLSGRLVAARSRVADAESQRARLEQMLADHTRWCEALGAPRGLSPERAPAWGHEVREAFKLSTQLVALSQKVDEDRRRVAAYETAMDELQVALEVCVPSGGLDEHIVWVEGLARASGQQVINLAKRNEREGLLNAARRESARVGQVREGLEVRLSRQLADAGCATVDHARAALTAHERWARASEAWASAQERFERSAGAERVNDLFMRRLTDEGLVEWTGRGAELGIEKEGLEARHEQVRVELAELRNEYRRLAESSDVARLQLECEAASRHLESLRVEWLRLRVARALLDATLLKLTHERQPEVLKRAALWLSMATANTYVAIESLDLEKPLDLALRDQTGRSHPVGSASLSVGTLALLYLCLRLALAVEHGRRTTMLPILLDDVLVHLDEQRAEGASLILKEVAKETQVWLFTCRPETTALVQQVHDDGVTCIRLPRWGGLEGPSARELGGKARGSIPKSAADAGARASAAASRREAVLVDAGPDQEELMARAIEVMGQRGASKKADFIDALALDEARWGVVRSALERRSDVCVEGAARGRTYRLAEADG